MIVVLNGEKRGCREGWTLADLVADLGLTGRRIAVELNRNIIPRDEYATRRLQPGDEIEVVHFVGGG
ncbi:MAG TPA: sulfur carrier protein ThiS [Candidatus Binatia bacterium]|nr:sulfur carrier protein ThiS [Candidatus Binatia bacterium]